MHMQQFGQMLATPQRVWFATEKPGEVWIWWCLFLGTPKMALFPSVFRKHTIVASSKKVTTKYCQTLITGARSNHVENPIEGMSRHVHPQNLEPPGRRSCYCFPQYCMCSFQYITTGGCRCDLTIASLPGGKRAHDTGPFGIPELSSWNCSDRFTCDLGRLRQPPSKSS